MRVALVLKSGGEYRAEHVDRLSSQILDMLPDAEIFCLSDVQTSINSTPLRFGWPGWWSKMELFRPDIKGDLLFFDLDTTITGSLDEIATTDRLTILRDFYRPDGLGSGMMFLPEASRAEIWNAFANAPRAWMRKHHVGGDQAFLESFWLQSATRWQDALPGQIASYKAHCRKGVPPGTRVVCYHGQPRPWAAEIRMT